MSSVTYRVEGDIGVVEVNNPPVNALSQHVREGLRKYMLEAQADGRVQAIVLVGKRVFLGGADIKEFENRSAKRTPTLVDVADTIEDSRKPVVAAISGFALGGGFEVAVSCHYRVSLDSTQYGFPEVDLGILPAASGTQRFSRLVGLEAALDIIPTGRRISAAEAQAMGAIDKIVKGDLLNETIRYAKSIAKQPFESRRASKRQVKDADKAVQLRDAATRKAEQKSKGMLAPIFCIKAVMASIEYPYDEGVQKEMEYANVLFSSGQSRALQYAFFAQRAAVKWDIPGFGSFKTAKPLPLRTGAVIGAGTMGSGIAMAMLNVGMPVVMIEQSEQFLKKGVDLLKSLYAGSVKLKKMTAAQAKGCLHNLKPSLNYADLRDVDIVIEAVFETMEIKQEVFRQMDKHCKASALLCSNTSALNIDQMAAVTSRPDKVIGTHFFVPAYHMRLLENVRGAKTSPQTVATAQSFGVKLGKIPIVVGNCDGFTANRMRGPQPREAVFLLEEGCSPDQIDRVMEDFGFPLGTLKVSDLSGLDIGYLQKQAVAKKLGINLTMDTRYMNGEKVSMISDYLVKEGKLGRKTGKGFYLYEKPGAKEPFPDPWLNDFLKKYSEKLGIERRQISTQEITERMVYSCINEGFKIMEEGISTRPEEIDTIWLMGFAWPRYSGGPMFYANMVGLQKVYERVCYYYSKHPTTRHWQPSELLRRLAQNDVPFKQWSKHVRVPGSNL